MHHGSVVFPQSESSSRSSVFYGWYILAACFVLLFFQAGARFSFGLMFKPMIAQLGWNRAPISLGFFLSMVFFALTLSIAGRLYDRYGPKWVVLVSFYIFAAAPMIGICASLRQGD